MPLIYAFVAQGTSVLAEYTPFHGNFNSVALECLQHLQPGQDKITITCDKHTFNWLRKEGFTFLVVADEAFGRQIPFAYLDRVSEDFLNSHATKAKSFTPGSLNRSFSPKLKQHMDYCTNNPDEISRIAACQKKVDDVKCIMVENIEKVLARGEKIELLVDKCDDLQHQAQTFHKQGKQLRSKMWWQNFRMKIIVAFAVVLLAVVIFLLACFAGGQNCTKKRS